MPPVSRVLLLATFGVGVACADPPRSPQGEAVPTARHAASAGSPRASSRDAASARPPSPAQQRPGRTPSVGTPRRPDGARTEFAEVTVFDNGRESTLSRRAAQAKGYVIIDLSDDWVPRPFRDDLLPGQPPNPFRARFVAMATDREDAHGEPLPKGAYNTLELYGIPPALSALAARWRAERARADCFARVDVAALRQLDRSLHYRSGRAAAREIATQAAAWQATLARLTRRPGTPLRRLRTARRAARLTQIRLRALRAAQARLACEGVVRPHRPLTPDRFDWNLHLALKQFERKHRIFGWGQIWGETRDALVRTPDENYHRALLRILTERLADQLGILEDGSVPLTVDGAAVAGGRDVLGAQSRAFAAALGVRTVEGARRFLLHRPPGWFARRVVAVRLPPRPAYYSQQMDLSVTIDRGDVWYEFPFDENGARRPQPVERRPRLTLFVRHGGKRLPLVRWPTTIGGWRTEVRKGCVYWRYKESPVGARVWKFLVAAPVWIPPPGTPPRELVGTVARNGLDRVVAKEWVLGPGPLSAYGLVALLHTRERTRRGAVVDQDSSIRTHGSADYMSILTSHSHGCHRLHNHLALRLASFLLHHLRHHPMGEQPIRWRAEVSYRGRYFHFARNRRGYYYRIDPPIPVLVLPGRIRGAARAPIRAAILKRGPQPPECAAGPARRTGAPPRLRPTGRTTPSRQAGAPRQDRGAVPRLD